MSYAYRNRMAEMGLEKLKCGQEEYTIKFNTTVFLRDEVWNKLGENKKQIYNNRGQCV